MSKDTGGPAFPFPVLHGKDAPTGMTLRDYFAAKAMQGYITFGVNWNCEQMAKYSYEMADAMLKAREE